SKGNLYDDQRQYCVRLKKTKGIVWREIEKEKKGRANDQQTKQDGGDLHPSYKYNTATEVLNPRKGVVVAVREDDDDDIIIIIAQS
ncbi:hypothetical protein ACJX0J_012748, partial [Zea mays]